MASTTPGSKLQSAAEVFIVSPAADHSPAQCMTTHHSQHVHYSSEVKKTHRTEGNLQHWLRQRQILVDIGMHCSIIRCSPDKRHELPVDLRMAGPGACQFARRLENMKTRVDKRCGQVASNHHFDQIRYCYIRISKVPTAKQISSSEFSKALFDL